MTKSNVFKFSQRFNDLVVINCMPTAMHSLTIPVLALDIFFCFNVTIFLSLDFCYTVHIICDLMKLNLSPIV